MNVLRNRQGESIGGSVPLIVLLRHPAQERSRPLWPWLLLAIVAVSAAWFIVDPSPLTGTLTW